MLNPSLANSLAQIFSSSAIRELANDSLSLQNKSRFRLLRKTLQTESTYLKVYEFLYGQLIENYRSEYVYKNAIINKLLLSRHSLYKSSLFEEFKVGKSVADIVIINGTSTVYEIKTDYDDLSRLESQLDSYRKVFDNIFVVTGPKNCAKLRKVLNPDIGIYLLTKEFTLSIERKSESHLKMLDVNEIFKIFTKKEYLSVIESEFGIQPKMSNTKIYLHCKELFRELSSLKAHKYLIEILAKRNSDKSFVEFIEKLPDSLKTIPFSVKLKKFEQENLIDRLYNLIT